MSNIKSLITVFLAAGFVGPHVVYAGWIDDIVSNAQSGNGIRVETHSSVSTGGQTVSGGGSVTTGDASASAHSETVVSSDDNGGNIDVTIESSHNGETKSQHYSQPIEKGKGIDVKVESSSKDGKSKAAVTVDGQKVETNATDSAAELSSTTTSQEPAASQSRIRVLFESRMPELIRKILSFFWIF